MSIGHIILLRNIIAVKVSKLVITNTIENPKVAIKTPIISGKIAIVKLSVP